MATDPNAAPVPPVVADPNAAPIVPAVVADPATGDPNASNASNPPAPEAPKVPDTYELVLPKDSVLPAATIERTAAIARELGLSNEAAQKVLESVNAEAAALSKAQEEAWEPGKGADWKRRDQEWKEAALKDADIGGTPDKLKVSTEKANLVLAKFFPPTIAEFLMASGLGSHPAVIKGLAAIGKGMSEGSLVLGAPPAPQPKTREDIMYGEGKQSAA